MKTKGIHMLRSLLILWMAGSSLLGVVGNSACGQDKLLGVVTPGGLLEKMLLLELNKVRATAGKPPFTLNQIVSRVTSGTVALWAGGEIPNTSEAVRGERAVARANALRKVYGNSITIEENFQPTGTPNSVVRTWMTHEKERNRILGDFHTVGIGIAADQTGECYYGVTFIGGEMPMYAVESRLLFRSLLFQLRDARERAKITKRMDQHQSLASASQEWAQLLADQNQTNQTRPLGATFRDGPLERTDYRYRDVGEVFGPGSSPEQVVEAWLKSDTGKQWLLNDRFDIEIGLGIARAKNGQLFWSLIVARPLD